MDKIKTENYYRALNIEDVHICIADSHPTTDIYEAHYVIELYPIRLKWTV